MKLTSHNKCKPLLKSEKMKQKHIQKVEEKFHTEHKCVLCSKSFSWARNLKTHIRTVHEGKKDYICSYCGKGFGTREKMKLHSTTVHEGIKRWKCDLCSNAYGQSHELKKHKLKTHDISK